MITFYFRIYSRTQYGIITWGNATDKYLNEVKVRQNDVLRIITFSKYPYSAIALYKELQLLKLKDIYKLELAKFMHKLHQNKLPKFFYDNFVNLSSQHSYGTQHACNSNYYLPRMQGRRWFGGLGPPTSEGWDPLILTTHITNIQLNYYFF